MPAEHVSGERLTAYRELRLTPRELIEVDDHLAVCHECRAQLNPAKRRTEVFQSVTAALASPDAHVSYDQLVGYVDNTLEVIDREIVDTHVESCTTCAMELRDLQAFAARMASREPRAPTMAAPRIVDDAKAQSTPVLRRVLDWFQRLVDVRQPALQVALAVTVLVLGVAVTLQQTRYRRLQRQSAALIDSVAALKKTNDSLQSTAQALEAANRSPSDRIVDIDRQAAQRAGGRPTEPSLQDTAGRASIGAGDTVMLAQAAVPSEFAGPVREFLMAGNVRPSGAAATGLAALDADVTRSMLGAEPARQSPGPISPVLTGIRSATPTLRWRAVASGREYKVSIAKKDGTVVWQASAGHETQIAMPAGILQRGRAYFWQVEALGDGAPVLAPPVGFWLLDQHSLDQVEKVERTFARSALVRASVYSAHALYDEALAQVEQLEQLNPDNRQVQRARATLRRQLGRE